MPAVHQAMQHVVEFCWVLGPEWFLEPDWKARHCLSTAVCGIFLISMLVAGEEYGDKCQKEGKTCHARHEKAG